MEYKKKSISQSLKKNIFLQIKMKIQPSED